MNESKHIYDYLVVGGGAAGYFSAICYFHFGKKFSSGDQKDANSHKVLILEAGRRVLTKVKVSGGGRCNVTHHEFEPKTLVNHYPRGGKSLTGGFFHFSPKDMMEFLNACGVDLKTEKDGRVFPVSDSSQTIIDCFKRVAKDYGVELKLGMKVSKISKSSLDGTFKLKTTRGEEFKAKNVLLATGSIADSYSLCESLGHEIVAPVPSLFTFKIDDTLIQDLPGTSVQNVAVKLFTHPRESQTKGVAEATEVNEGLQMKGKSDSERPFYKGQGPLLVTHWGLSGPAVLKASAFGARELHASGYKAILKVDFLPDLNQQRAIERLQECRNTQKPNQMRKFSPFESISKKLWARFLDVCDIKEDMKWSEVSNAIVRDVVQAMKGYHFKVDGKGVFKEEFVTSGGVDLASIDLKTMMSRKVEGLYFAGELTNVDGVTGGFNFQNAWTSAYLAAVSAAQSKEG